MRRHVLVHGIYLALSLLFASRFFSLAHPTSFAITEGDPALMCWTLQWVSRALLHDPWHLFAGNAFFPYRHSIVLSDAMVTLAAVNAPIRLVTKNPWVGHNLLIVLAYYLSCVWAAWFVREWMRSEVAAFWGGIFWGFLFFRVHHIGHLQMLSFQGIPGAAAALLRFWRRPGLGSSLRFSVLFIAQALVSWYLAVIMTVILAVLALCAGRDHVFRRRTAKYYALIGAVCAAAIVPVALPYRRAFADSTLGDRLALVNSFGDAVHPSDYLTPPASTLVGQAITDNRYSIWGENTLYIGVVPLLLSAAGLVWAARAAMRSGKSAEAGHARRLLATGLALVVVGYVLSLGFVSPSLGMPLPLHYLARAVPAIAGLRATPRFSIVVYFGVLVLSAAGLQALVAGWPRRQQIAGCAAACALFLLDVFPVNLPVHAGHAYEVSAPDRAIASYQRSRSEPLVVLHVPINYFREPYPVSEATYMLDSTEHWARILNGFSGSVPRDFMDRMTTLNRLPERDAVRLLLDLGVDIVAVHRGATEDTRLRDFFQRQPWAAISPLPTGEYLVLIDRAKSRTNREQ